LINFDYKFNIFDYFFILLKNVKQIFKFVSSFLGSFCSQTPYRSGNPEFLGLCQIFSNKIYFILYITFEWRSIENFYFFYDRFFIVISLWFMLLLFTRKIASVSGTLGIFLDSLGSPTTHARNFNYSLNDSRFSVVLESRVLSILGVGPLLVRVYFWFLRLGWVFSNPKSHVHLQYMWFIPKPGWNYFNFSPFHAFQIDSENGMRVFDFRGTIFFMSWFVHSRWIVWVFLCWIVF